LVKALSALRMYIGNNQPLILTFRTLFSGPLRVF
jgi:hypothetical protein